MSKRTLNEAIVAISAKIRAGEIADIQAEIVGDDPEAYVLDAVNAVYRGNFASARRSLNAAQRNGLSAQLEIDGLDHASLPMVVWGKAEDGRDVAVPAGRATFKQIKAEVRKHRRAVSIQDRTVGGWEATLSRLEDLGVSDDWTQDEIEEHFGRPALGGDDA